VEFAVLQGVSPATQGLVIVKESTETSQGVVRSVGMNAVGANVDAQAEGIFKQDEVFIAGPEEGLKMRRNLEYGFQTMPPDADCAAAVEGLGDLRDKR